METEGCDERKIFEVLETFPELRDGKCGLYDITALQVVAALAESGGGVAATRALVSCGGDVNRADFLGRTPLHYAAANGNVALVHVLLDLGATTECTFNCRQQLLMNDDEVKKRWDVLLQKLPPPDGWGRTPLHVATKNSHLEIVKLLLLRGANIDARDSTGLTPLLLAGSHQEAETFEDIVQILVENGADVNVKNNATGTTVLLHAVALRSLKATEALLKAGAWLQENLCKQTELHEAASKGLLEILEVFLGDSRMTQYMINKVDASGRSALCRAAYGGYKECVRLLLENGANLAQVTFDDETVADMIFRNVAKPVAFVQEIFDSRVQINNSEDSCVSVDFEILAPFGQDNQMLVLSHLLSAANDEEKLQILQHPFIETYLRLKWDKIRPFFLLQLISHFLFALSLSAYSLLLVRRPAKMEIALLTARILLTMTSSGLLVHNIIQCALVGRNFVRQHELWMNFSCTSVSLAVALLIDSTMLPLWVLHVTSIAVLLTWTELMLLIGRFPTYGYYALMFSVVFRNVIKLLSTFICLIIGFALSFTIQFHNTKQFNNPWKSVVKTVTMMMGEYEYGDLFGDDPHVTPRLVATSRVIFLLFIILASIVLMNLMVGVAVNDIQALQIEGHAKRLEKQAEFIRQLERVVSLKIVRSKWFPQYLGRYFRRKCCIRTKLIMYPEMRWSWKNKSIFKLLPCSLVEKLISIALNHEDNTESEREADKCKVLSDLIATLNLHLQRLEKRHSTTGVEKPQLELYKSKRRKISFEQI